MDRQFSSPRAVASSSPEELQRALRRVVGGLDAPTQFLYDAEFEYANGRKAPLLMVGALRGAWRDHIRRNAASPRFSAGECHPRRDADGRLVLELVANRGRARGGSHTRAINRALMRGIGEVQFVDAPAATPATSGGPPPAGDEAASGGDAAAAAPPASAPDDAALLEAFNDFKAAPTAAKLDALLAGVAAWRAAGGGGDKAAAVEKMATVLEQKGRAYVASKGG